jgi:hypothetical protein
MRTTLLEEAGKVVKGRWKPMFFMIDKSMVNKNAIETGTVASLGVATHFILAHDASSSIPRCSYQDMPVSCDAGWTHVTSFIMRTSLTSCSPGNPALGL